MLNVREAEWSTKVCNVQLLQLYIRHADKLSWLAIGNLCIQQSVKEEGTGSCHKRCKVDLKASKRERKWNEIENEGMAWRLD